MFTGLPYKRWRRNSFSLSSFESWEELILRHECEFKRAWIKVCEVVDGVAKKSMATLTGYSNTGTAGVLHGWDGDAMAALTKQIEKWKGHEEYLIIGRFIK